MTAPPVSAAATEPAAPPAPVDKDFQRAAKRADRLFVVHISDPTKVGLGATAHIVYTVTTTLRVPTEYGTQSKEVAVLRRFSDFLWLFGALSEGNRGVVVPPVPDKQSFGVFSWPRPLAAGWTVRLTTSLVRLLQAASATSSLPTGGPSFRRSSPRLPNMPSSSLTRS